MLGPVRSGFGCWTSAAIALGRRGGEFGVEAAAFRSTLAHQSGGDRKPTVVIVGGGWGGYATLMNIDQKAFNVKIVSPRNHFLFTPLLASTTVGTLSFRSIIEPLRSKRLPHEYYQASMIGLDQSNKQLVCEGVLSKNSFKLDYDYLVLAPGARNNTFGIKGVEEHAMFLKELNQARRIRNKILQCFEQANLPTCDPVERRRLLTFVCCGAGPTSCEFAGEFADFFWTDLRKAFPNVSVHDVAIEILEASDRILPMFEQRLVDFALSTFKREGIHVRLRSPVQEVTEQGVVLRGGEVIPSGCVVWSTGVAPHRVFEELPFEHSHGRLIIDDHLRLPGAKDIFALGDAAVDPDSPLPATAQAAHQQGLYMARTLNQMVNQSWKPVEPFRFKFMGLMAALGDYKAIVDTPAGPKFTGWMAWFAWRSVYLTKLGSWTTKMGVPFDWLKTLLFGRDVTTF